MTGEYRYDLLEIVDAEFDWAGALPPVQDAVDALGTGDNMAAALGLGMVPGDVAISLGTSGTVFAVSETVTADPTGAVAGFADAAGRYLPLVCTLNATKVTDTVARVLGVDHLGLDALALAAAPGASGLTLVPYFDGERTPNRPDARGALVGLHPDASREAVARAAYEGVVCGLLDGLDALRAVEVPVDGRLFLVGGGARSIAYRKVVADLAQRPVTVVADDELVALGACVQASARAQQVSIAEVQAAWNLGRGHEIDPSASADAAEAIRSDYARAHGARIRT